VAPDIRIDRYPKSKILLAEMEGLLPRIADRLVRVQRRGVMKVFQDAIGDMVQLVRGSEVCRVDCEEDLRLAGLQRRL
jgi:hypothetical protein